MFTNLGITRYIINKINYQKKSYHVYQNQQKYHQFIEQTKINFSYGAFLWALLFSSAGLFYWPLGLLSIPFLIWLKKDNFVEVYQAIINKKINAAIIFFITDILAIIMGLFFVVTLALIFNKLAIDFAKTINQSSKHKLIDAFSEFSQFVWILQNDIEIKIPFEHIKPQDIIIVYAGEVIPVDGLVIEGIAQIDQHLLTGESNPVEKHIGHQVFTATLVLTGKLYIKVEKTGTETTVAKLQEILNQSTKFTSQIQLEAEKISDSLVMPILFSGLLVAPILGLNSAIATLYAYPRNRMLLLTPISILNYINKASRQGILIKQGQALELLNQIDTIIFDKTGTLTYAIPQVASIESYSHYSEQEILTLAAAAEYKQQHPIAQALQQSAEKAKLTLPEVNNIHYKVGYGVIAEIADKTVYMGSQRFMQMEKLIIPENINHSSEYSLVFIAINQEIIGHISLAPSLRPEIKEIIETLQAKEKQIYIISGDSNKVTQEIAEQLNIKNYFAEVLPEEKADIVNKIQQEGHKVCYIGDGINDALVLKKAMVSISLRGASTIAKDSAQIILLDSGLKHLLKLFNISEHYRKNINRSFAIIMASTAFILAGILLLDFGFTDAVTISIAGVFMALINTIWPLIFYKFK